ncbi:hypothetical protein BST40_25530, partial [Mycobacterium persicum]
MGSGRDRDGRLSRGSGGGCCAVGLAPTGATEPAQLRLRQHRPRQHRLLQRRHPQRRHRQPQPPL